MANEQNDREAIVVAARTAVNELRRDPTVANVARVARLMLADETIILEDVGLTADEWKELRLSALKGLVADTAECNDDLSRTSSVEKIPTQLAFHRLMDRLFGRRD